MNAATYNEACRIDREYRRAVRAAWLDGLWLVSMVALGIGVGAMFGYHFGSTPAPSACYSVRVHAAGPVETCEEPRQVPLATPQRPAPETELSRARIAPGGPGERGLFRVTAYCNCRICCGKNPGEPGYGITKSGAKAKHGTCASDPTRLPLGTVVSIPGYGSATCADTGSAIKGNRLDVWCKDHQTATAWGVKWLTVETVK